MTAAIIEGCQLLAAVVVIALALSLADRRIYVRRLHQMRRS